MMMKNLFPFLLAVLLLAGCAANEPKQEPTMTPNPMVEYENAEFPDFTLIGYPDHDGMRPTSFYLIGGHLAEINYENATLRCRGIAENEADISGVYYADPKESAISVGHAFCNGLIEVTVKEYGENGTVALWNACSDPFHFSLWLPELTFAEAEETIRTVVANLHIEVNP